MDSSLLKDPVVIPPINFIPTRNASFGSQHMKSVYYKKLLILYVQELDYVIPVDGETAPDELARRTRLCNSS
jgi:hypothetical protein